MNWKNNLETFLADMSPTHFLAGQADLAVANRSNHQVSTRAVFFFFFCTTCTHTNSKTLPPRQPGAACKASDTSARPSWRGSMHQTTGGEVWPVWCMTQGVTEQRGPWGREEETIRSGRWEEKPTASARKAVFLNGTLPAVRRTL